MSHATEQPRKRTPEEIEADLARTRLELTSTVNELSDKLDPRRQVDAAKDSAKAAAAAAGGRAKAAAAAAGGQAKAFADDLGSGDRKALTVLGAVLAAGATLIAVARRSR
ncbi:DUF3618 domain-containing protein [Georgenia sp. SYP-B2076]|uniref:DUF3618 domain-containing protein n=1 Tax=Georgenia sp. SYP-B2076 TaxID=2495881 RepID=UPI000F8D4746|nr:DUF3618 domain-containing protein [Georgenia sp. SYP-B2076]